MINQITLNPPAAHQTGDTYTVEHGYLSQMRNGNTVYIWNLRTMVSQRLNNIVVSGGTQIETLYLEKAMPGINASLVDVTTDPTGKVTFFFDDSSSLQYSDWASIADEADSIDANIGFAHKLLIAKSFRLDPDGVNKTRFVRGMVSVNLNADQSISFVEPV